MRVLSPIGRSGELLHCKGSDCLRMCLVVSRGNDASPDVIWNNWLRFGLSISLSLSAAGTLSLPCTLLSFSPSDCQICYISRGPSCRSVLCLCLRHARMCQTLEQDVRQNTAGGRKEREGRSKFDHRTKRLTVSDTQHRCGDCRSSRSFLNPFAPSMLAVQRRRCPSDFVLSLIHI